MNEISSDERFISGHRTVDNEHRLQLSLLAAVRQAVADARPAAEIEEILERFVDFTKVHFASEASLMRLFQYPQYQSHTEEHDHTLEQIEELEAARRSGRTALTLQRVDALSAGIRQHMLSTDDALGRYLVRLGVGPG
jgi:hemerythrin